MEALIMTKLEAEGFRIIRHNGIQISEKLERFLSQEILKKHNNPDYFQTRSKFGRIFSIVFTYEECKTSRPDTFALHLVSHQKLDGIESVLRGLKKQFSERGLHKIVDLDALLLGIGQRAASVDALQLDWSMQEKGGLNEIW